MRRLRACAGGRLVIVKLQRTPKDRRAALVIRACADCVMAGVMAALRLRVRLARPRAPRRTRGRASAAGQRLPAACTAAGPLCC